MGLLDAVYPPPTPPADLENFEAAGKNRNVCDLIDEAKEALQNNDKEQTMALLEMIDNACERMENRLLKYCRAIERLGFTRNRNEKET